VKKRGDFHLLSDVDLASDPSNGFTRGGGDFIWPVSAPISSKFGKRGRRQHKGIDLMAPRGTPIRAAASGMVKYAGWQKGYGYTIELFHPETQLVSLYAHCHQIKVSKGSRISQGQIIGTVGKTGRATGYHLHF